MGSIVKSMFSKSKPRSKNVILQSTYVDTFLENQLFYL